MKLKKALAATMAAAMVFSLAGCGSKAPVESTGNTAVESKEEDVKAADAVQESSDITGSMEGTKISFLTCQGKFKEEYRTMAEEIKKDYGIEVDFQVVPDNEYFSLLKVKLATSEAPDVFEYNYPTQNIEIGAAENCVDLSGEEWVSRLVNPDLIKDPNDGKFYALPKESSSSYQAVYYNKAVLEKCGITDPQPKTYQEFLDILDTIKEKGEGVTPLYCTNKDTWTTQIYPTGSFSVSLGDKAAETYTKIEKNELAWTEVPEFKETLDEFKALFDKGYVNQDFMSATYDTAAGKMAAGEMACCITIEGFAADMNSKYPDCEVGAFVLPYGDNELLATGAYVQGLFIPKASKQVENAKEFLKIWSDPKYQDIYYQTQPGFSAFNDVNGGEVPAALQYLVDHYISTGKYEIQMNDYMSVCAAAFPDLWNYYNEMLSGTKTSDEVLETWQKQYVDFMQQQGKDGF